MSKHLNLKGDLNGDRHSSSAQGRAAQQSDSGLQTGTKTGKNTTAAARSARESSGMTEISTQWCIGWKVANTYLGNDKRTLQFAPVHQDGLVVPHGVDDEAMCMQHPWHTPPEDDCGCGFNAWHDAPLAMNYMRAVKRHMRYGCKQSLVLLRVGLCGDVIEGTFSTMPLWPWGYRASRQCVADVFFGADCHTDACEGVACTLALTNYNHVFGWVLRPFCRACGARRNDVVNPTRLAEENNVALHWQYASE